MNRVLGPRTGAPVARITDHATLIASLGITADATYEAIQTARRNRIVDSLAGCAPANAFPGEMAGYLAESALRFAETLAWIEDLLGASATGGDASLLETGSNPYFLTILLAERFPDLRHVGINFFGNPDTPVAMESQDVVDPKRRIGRSAYLHADVERTPLTGIGPFDVCLFCEVVEHLPWDPGWATFNLARCVRAGGHLLLTTPNPARLDNIARLALHTGSKDDPISGYGIHGRHNREYTAAELEDLLRGTGFSIVRSRSLDVHPNVWSKNLEQRGYGHYLMVLARLESAPRLYRPDWLYRSFEPSRLAQAASLAP